VGNSPLRHPTEARGLAADVNVTGTWQALEDPPSLADVRMTIDVPASVETMRAALLSELQQRAAARSLDTASVDIQLSRFEDW